MMNFEGMRLKVNNNIKVQIKKCGRDWLYVGQAKI